MSNPHEEDKNPGDQEARIILKVKSQDDEVFLRIKKTTKLKKQMYVYCDRRGLKLDAFAFLFDGKRIRGNETPDELDMKDGDKIDACRPMGGGLRANQRQWSYMVFDKEKRETFLAEKKGKLFLMFTCGMEKPVVFKQGSLQWEKMSSTELDGFTVFFSSYYSQIKTTLPWMRNNLCSLRFGNKRMRCLSYSFDKSRYNPYKGSLS